MGSISNNLRTSLTMRNDILIRPSFSLNSYRVNLLNIAKCISEILFFPFNQTNCTFLVFWDKKNVQSSASFKLYAFIRTIGNELIHFPELHLHVKISFYFYAISLLDFIGGYILYVSVSTPLKHLWIIITELIFYEIAIQLYFAYIISYTSKIISMHFMEKFYHKLRHLLEQ